ncbi:hypothetical protein BC829DRAFT_422736 [Chytridium lagenaria]|nr:hypothetical protein BC829DRAFT_422736 [Chytridium lagenaria]
MDGSVEALAGAPSHASPFFLFKAFFKSVPLEDNKYHFKTYPRSFTTETAQNTMVQVASCSREDAIDFLTKFLQGQLIQDLEKPKEAFELKPRHVYGLTVKGVKSVTAIVRSDVIYVDRHADGSLKSGPLVTELIFKAMLGDKPNVGSSNRKSSDDAGAEGSAMGSPSRNGSVANLNGDLGVCSIKPVQLHTRIVRLKSQPFTFTGAEAVDWILMHTSVLSRDEALSVASSFASMGWINSAGSALVETSGSSNSTVKDAKSGVYQPTQSGCRMARWSVEFDVNKKKFAVRTDADEEDGNNSRESPTGLSPFSINSGVDDSPVSGSPSKSPSNRNSFYTGVSASVGNRGSNDNLAKIAAGGSSSKSGTPTTVEAFDWEVCHLNPVSMNGSEGRSGQRSSSITAKDATVTAASLAAAARSKRISHHLWSIHRLTEEGVGGYSSHRRLQANFSVDQIKDSNPTRLVQILTNEELRASFHLFDVHAFRTAYSNSLVIPGQALSPDTQPDKDPNPLMIPHAMALYLKYVVNDAPFELNIVIGIRKSIEAVITQTSQYMQHIDPDSIAVEEKIDPSKVLLDSGAETLAKFPKALPGIVASMFDSAEHHIFHLMANDSVPKFIKTKMYGDIMTELFVSGSVVWKGAAANGLLRRRSVEGTTDTLAGIGNANADEGPVVRRKSSLIVTTGFTLERKGNAAIDQNSEGRDVGIDETMGVPEVKEEEQMRLCRLNLMRMEKSWWRSCSS